MLEHLVAWLVTAMLSWSPASNHDYTHRTHAQTEQRYTALAANISVVALDETIDPLFAGQDGRAKTALLVAAVASFEGGGFRADVDTDAGTGDKKAAHCLMQLHQATQGSLDCYRKAIVWLRSSMRDCRALPFRWRLAEYASGDCRHGTRESEHRMDRALKWWASHPFSLEPDVLSSAH